MISIMLENIIVVSAVLSAVSLLLLLARKLFSPKGGAWMRSIIWTVLLIRLCIPFMPSLPVGLIEGRILQPGLLSYLPSDYYYEASSPVEPEPEHILPEKNIATPEEKIANGTFVSRIDIMSWAYIAGFAVFAIFAVSRKILLVKSLSRLKSCKNSLVLSVFEKTKKHLNIKRNITLLIDEGNAPPAVCGIMRPCIIIPKSLMESADVQEVEYVFIHELTHYKNFDIIKLLLLEAVTVIHWFNPIFHLIKSIVIQDIELACDEKVLSIISKENHADYGKMLLEFSRRTPRNIPLVLTSNFAGKRAKNLKERIVMINKFKKKNFSIAGLAIVILISLLLVVLPSCKSAGDTDDKDTADLDKALENAIITYYTNDSNIREEDLREILENAIITFQSSSMSEQDSGEIFGNAIVALQIIENGVSEEANKNMVSLIRDWCEAQGLSYKVTKYISASTLLWNVGLSQDTQDLGASIRSILSDYLGLSPQQIVSDDGSRLDSSIAELISKHS